MLEGAPRAFDQRKEAGEPAPAGSVHQAEALLTTRRRKEGRCGASVSITAAASMAAYSSSRALAMIEPKRWMSRSSKRKRVPYILSQQSSPPSRLASFLKQSADGIRAKRFILLFHSNVVARAGVDVVVSVRGLRSGCGRRWLRLLHACLIFRFPLLVDLRPLHSVHNRAIRLPAAAPLFALTHDAAIAARCFPAQRQSGAQYAQRQQVIGATVIERQIGVRDDFDACGLCDSKHRGPPLGIEKHLIAVHGGVAANQRIPGVVAGLAGEIQPDS